MRLPPMPELTPLYVDLDAHDLHRAMFCALAGWTPAIGGEIRARELLHTGLDQRQEALLAEMATWNVAG